MRSNDSQLAVVVTRLSAPKGHIDDEFVHEWLNFFPGKRLEDIADLEYIVGTSEGHKLLLIHGFDGLLDKKAESRLEAVVLRFIEEAGIIIDHFAKLWVCVHGSLPETGNRAIQKDLPNLGDRAILISYTASYLMSPTLGLLEMLRQPSTSFSLSTGLYNLIEEKMRVVPIVERIVVEMQGLIMQIRLIVEMLRMRTADDKKDDERFSEMLLTARNNMVKKISNSAMQKTLNWCFECDQVTLEQFALDPINEKDGLESIPDNVKIANSDKSLINQLFFNDSGNLSSIAELSDESIRYLSVRVKWLPKAAQSCEQAFLKRTSPQERTRS